MSSQSCCKHHSIETTLLYIHDNLIDTVGSQKVIMSLPPWSFCHFFNVDHSSMVWNSTALS